MPLSENALLHDSKQHRVKVSEIYADSEFNCRGHISANSLIELVKDVSDKGLLEPIIIRELWPTESNIKAKGFKYSLVAGFRRLSAYKVAEAELIPVHLRDIKTEFEARDINAVENLQRVDLSIWQEAKSIRHYWLASWNRQDIASRVSKSDGWVQVRVMLLEMEPEIQNAADQGYLTQTEIRELNKFKGAERLKIAGLTIAAKKRGEKVDRVARIKKPDKYNTKKKRTADEILDIMDIVREICADCDLDYQIPLRELVSPEGNLLPFHKIMAWINGEITTLECHTFLRTFAQKIGVSYEIPALDYN